MKRTWKFALTGIALMVISYRACSLSDSAIDGIVLDEATGKPVADAIVVVNWDGDYWAGAGRRFICYHVETAVTNEAGKFHIEGWSMGISFDNFSITPRHVRAEAFKPGYVRSTNIEDKPKKIFIRPFGGTKEEYFEFLDALVGSNYCVGRYAGASSRHLYRLYKRVAAEAEGIAETKKQKKDAEKYARFARSVLVDPSKPTTFDSSGYTININPQDNFPKEE